MRENRIITLITDFGFKDWYAGVMRGIILSINPSARIIDISHEVERGDVVAASFVLANSFRYFPRGTVHLVVVDPGVGGDRKVLLARSDGVFFIAPDNGVLDLVLGKESEVRSIENRDYRLKDVSNTFHGRDIFAPAAAHLSLGVELKRFGPLCKSFSRIGMAVPRTKGNGVFEAEVIYVDHFGNLITNIKKGVHLARGSEGIVVRIAGREIKGLRRTYVDVPEGELVAIYGSGGYMEVSVNGGSAAEKLGVERGDKLIVELG